MLFKGLQQRRGFSQFISGNFAKAEEIFARLAEAEPDRVGPRRNLALVKLALGKYAEAVDLLRAEVERFGDEYQRLRALGDACYLWGKREEAARWYKAALKESSAPWDTAFLKARLDICADGELFDAAVAAARTFDRGSRALKKKNTEDARTELEAAVEGDPTNFMARNNLGSIYMNNDSEYSKAALQFEEALKYTNLPLIRKNLRLCREKEEKNEDG